MSTKLLVIIICIIIFGGATFSAANLPQNVETERKAHPTLQPMPTEEILGTAIVSTDVTKTVYENLVHTKEHTILTKLLSAADLETTMQGNKPYTIFAPTDSAFEKLPEGTITTLLKPENNNQLRKLLEAHIVAGIYQTSDFSNNLTVKTINGQSIIFTKEEGSWSLNKTQGTQSRIEKGDGTASNGTIQVINTVLLPNY